MDLEKTCGTCKFRGENIIWPDPDNDFNDTDSGYAQCMRIKFAESGFKGRGNGAIVQDGSGYYGRLCVEADFGCVKWEYRWRLPAQRVPNHHIHRALRQFMRERPGGIGLLGAGR